MTICFALFELCLLSPPTLHVPSLLAHYTCAFSLRPLYMCFLSPPTIHVPKILFFHCSERAVCNAVAPGKDVDGFHLINVGRFCTDLKSMLPATPAGIMELLRRTGMYCIVFRGIYFIIMAVQSYVTYRSLLFINCEGEYILICLKCMCLFAGSMQLSPC